MTYPVQRYFICSFSCLWLLLSFGCQVSTTSKDGISYCGLADSSSRLVFVSTLDGKLTALNPNNNGAVLWTIHPGSDSMLSSSIHKLELSNYGHLVRMIPSLDGGLYKFNGENIELIPVTSDHLLQSSLRYSDDLVISGGKETHTYGVSLTTGNTIYECSMKSCGNVSRSTDTGEILVIQRRAQVVRAVEPRTGAERWNFSVAQLDLKLVSECHSLVNNELNYQIKVIIPEGLVYAADTKDSSKVLWKQKFNSPVIGAWQLHMGKLVQIDLFSSQVSNFHSPFSPSPSIYIGMYDKQLYIQESLTMLRKRVEITSKSNQNLIVSEKNYPVIPWKPVPASNVVYGLTWEPETESESENALDDNSQRQTTALSVLYASPYVDGNGFFLYTEDELNKLKSGSCNASESEEESSDMITEVFEDSMTESKEIVAEFVEANTPVEIVVVSFWYYWKEVLVISATTALICNLMITRTYMRKFKDLSRSSGSKDSESENLVQKKDSGIDTSTEELDVIVKMNSIQDYISRYLMDFEPVACLGKGGFGVVFEAKNKIDDCHYAIKRILLPRRQESRDRVLREVKALAKLDHHHIVRYFNAWTECPPSGWQEKHDKLWLDMNSEMFTSMGAGFTQSLTTLSTTANRSHSVGIFQPSESVDDFIDESSLGRNNLQNDISDSFVVFGNEEEEEKKDENKESELIKPANITRTSENMITVDLSCESTTESRSNVLSNKHLSKPTSLKLDQTVSIGSECMSKVYLYIQMQLCQRNSLRDWLTVNSDRDYQYVLSIFEQILQAVEHVHLNGLIHRDLKPSNIFFSLDNQIKVGDFGLVTAMTDEDDQITPIEAVEKSIHGERHTAQVGTQLYMSREQLLGKPYNYKVDIYSLGLILFELLVPFSTQMERVQVLQNIKKDRFPESFQKTYKKEYELLRLMLSDSPEERPTTYGIRARLPLKQEPVEDNWHFELPVIRKSSRIRTSSTSHFDGYLMS